MRLAEATSERVDKSGNKKNRKLFDDDLALHMFVAQAADMATLERIGSGSLRDELNCGGLPFLELYAILW